MRLALLALAAGPAAACPLAAPALAGDGVQVEWQVEGGTALAVGRAFALQGRVCPAGARVLRVDATMPEHRHGMNYRPTLTAAAEGAWRAQGLLWHMPGRWELRFDVEHEGRVRTLRQSVEVK